MAIIDTSAFPLRKETAFPFPFRSSVSPAVLVAVILLVFYNARFWTETAAALWNGTLRDTLFLGSLFLFLLFLHATALLIVPDGKAFRVTATILFMIAAVAAYSADTYGVFIDKDMVRNLFETDQREAAALFNLRFVTYLVMLGVAPSALVWRVRLPKVEIRQQLLQRLGFFLGGLVLSVSMLFAFSAHYSSFLREHKSLRYLLSPGAAIQGAIQYVRGTFADPADAQVVDNDGPTIRSAQNTGGKPLLMFLVIGETARARNFQLGGYERPTNPELAKLDNVYYFNNVTSCGTSTAISLPCMFSHLGRGDFSVSVAGHTTNLLDALTKAGIGIQWRDNNSGSKGVSARADTINFDKRIDPELCNQESCYDEIMLKDLDKRLAAVKDDTVIAFHQIGSHGPSYSKRYPQQFERFSPVCGTNELKQCSEEEIRNAYDNSIVYTDHNIARQIAILKSLSDRFDTMLIYVSDHGESLGEKGLYLHGAPYIFAPDEQKKVPFVLWMSDGYRQRFALDSQCMQAQLGKPFSHDNLYHTVLGAMTVKNDLYQSSQDMLAACRNRDVTASVAHNVQ